MAGMDGKGAFTGASGTGSGADDCLKVEAVLSQYAERMSRKTGISRRAFLSTASGMAAFFLAANAVHGHLFMVEPAEASDRSAAAEAARRLKNQFVFDMQTHFVNGAYSEKRILSLRDEAKKWNRQLLGEHSTLDCMRFGPFVKEIFMESDTTMALLSSAPADDPGRWFLHNREVVDARAKINSFAGSRRMFANAVFTPGRSGWLDGIRIAAERKPDSWKGYPVGTPFGLSKWPWRMDDEKKVYPGYQRIAESGITTICIHKGLLPAGHQTLMRPNWRYAAPDDIPKAAQDWPQLNFVIFHAAYRSATPPSSKDVDAFERSGHIPWVSELAEMPKKYGISNLYAELGSVFALTAVSNPRYCAGILGTLIKGFGHERVLWGTDSTWYGSPQWQIEAFRRMEIPEDLQRKFAFAPLGPADGVVKRAILGGNAARLYGIKPPVAGVAKDVIGEMKSGQRALHAHA
ncbi:amidohydrolase family protein [Geotalea sp. SG265]|uniref:amidohydrolase family protein n=1 Tax=Geotalea sp. SG265 TaxID=2922867 RepID=UPI001FAEE698|nr:amidohydrolase family protein [Geotalea sp. SG265]